MNISFIKIVIQLLFNKFHKPQKKGQASVAGFEEIVKISMILIAASIFLYLVIRVFYIARPK